MSGLEPLAALGLACNILQLVELGCKTIDCIKTVYKGGKIDQDLASNAAALEALTEEVKRTAPPGKKRIEKILIEWADKCAKAARDLAEEVRFLVGTAKTGNLASALKVVSKVAWRQRRLERLRGNLQEAEKIMNTTLLAQIWSSTNAAAIDLSGVRQDLRLFIEQYRQGCQETGQLVSTEGLKTRNHVSYEAKRTNEAVACVEKKADRLVGLGEAQVDEQARDRILQSLKFPGFNERRSQVAESYGDSFNWVFVGDNDDESDEGSESDGSQNSEDGRSRDTSNSGSIFSGDLQGSTDSDEESNDSEEEGPQIQWDSFSNWLSSTDSIYWISGKPGSGKTTLVKYILAHERTKKYLNIWSPGCEIISHYFWRPGSQMQKNFEGLLCSLLYQLLDGSAIALGELRSSVSGSKDSYTDWSRAELRSALLMALDCYDHGMCLFLDGLDEIDPQDGTQPGIPEFLDWVFELSQRSRIKICLASRPDPPILEIQLSSYPRLRLQDLNYRDLMKYARGHIKFPKTYIFEEDDSPTKFLESLVCKAEGVFLWLLLAMKSMNEGIRYGDSARLLKERIDRLPKGLDSLYQDMWERLGAENPLEYRQTAALYFKFTLARRLSYDYLHLGILALMLAATSVGDGLFDALDDPLKLVCPDTILEKCGEVRKKLNIYCVGLVEVHTADFPSVEEVAANCSWYGRQYDSVFNNYYELRLRFIHRTAHDFLTDTELGGKILGFDKSSEFTIHYRLLKAWLARLSLFSESGSQFAWAYELAQFRRRWEGTKEWVPEDWNRLVLLCEKLANSGRIFASGTRQMVIPCVGVQFLKELVLFGCDDEFVISRVKNGNLSVNEKSDILLSLAAAKVWWRDWFHPRSFRESLKAGADTNWQGWARWTFRSENGTYHAPLETPWQQFLFNVAEHLFDRDFGLTWEVLASMVECTFLLHSHGADFDCMVNMAMASSSRPSIWGVQNIIYSFGHLGRQHCLFVSLPGHTIVKSLINTVRSWSLRTGEESISAELLHWCQTLDQACTNRRSSNTCRVFGKLGRIDDRRNGYVWSETTDEVQMQFGDMLMEAVERRFTLTMMTPYVEGDSESRVTWTDRHNSTNVAIQSIYDADSWELKLDRPEGSKENILKQVEELGIMARVDGPRSMREYVQEHSEKFQSRIIS